MFLGYIHIMNPIFQSDIPFLLKKTSKQKKLKKNLILIFKLQHKI